MHLLVVLCVLLLLAVLLSLLVLLVCMRAQRRVLNRASQQSQSRPERRHGPIVTFMEAGCEQLGEPFIVDCEKGKKVSGG